MEDDALKRVAFAAVFLCALPALGAATPVGGACVADAECVAGAVCENKVCASTTGRSRVVPPFYFHKKGAYGYRDITPIFYFHHWRPDGDRLVQFPFFWRFKDGESTDTVVPLPVPLIWSRSATKRIFAAPFLLAGASTDEKTGESWKVWIPFFFDHRDRESHTTISILSWFKSSPGHSAGVIFPLFWHVKDTVQGYQHTLLIPFVDYESDARGRHKRVVSPLGFYEKDDEAGMKQGLLLTPPVFYRRDPQRTVTVVPPLFTSWKVHGDGSSGWMAGPLFHSSDPEGTTSGFFPLYWRWSDRHTHASTDWLFPVAGVYKSPDARGAYVGPAYGWTSKNGWGAGLAPLFFAGRSGKKSHAVLFPLFWRFSDDKTSTTVVGPAFYHKADDGWDAGLAPALLVGRHGDRNYGVVPPIYWHFGQKNGTTTDVAGPLYVQRGPDGWRAGLAPLLFFANKGGRSHQVIFPILFHFADRDHDRLLIGPFYHGRDGDKRVDVLFPLMYLQRSPRGGLLITPLAGWQKTPEQETLVVGPWIQRRNFVKHSTTRYLFPLGGVYQSPDYKVTFQFPFFWRVREGDETDTVVFPVYWRVRSPRMTFDGVFPLFARAKTDVATTTVFGPIWNRTRTDGGRNLGMFPLFAYGSNIKDGKSAHWFGMPGLYYRDNQRDGSGEMVLGPFYDAWRPGRWDAGLPPLVFAWKRNTARYLVTPIFYRQSDSAANSSMNVLGPIYWGHSGTTKKFGLFPLFFARTGEKGTAAGIFPLIYVNAKPHGSVGVTPVFGWSKYETGWRFYLGPIYARRDQEYSSTAVWPLAYFSKNLHTGALTRMVLPFYFDGRTDDGRELQVMTPAIWRYHSVERTVLVGLPGFFDVHTFGESRATGFFPLFIRQRDWAKQSVSYTFPVLFLFARHRYGGTDPGTDVVWFPLVWRYGGKDSTTVVAPLFFDFKRGESRTTIGLPAFVYWKRNDAKRLVLLNMYYRRGINHEEGNWHCYVIPLFDFGRPRKKDLDWSVLMGLFGYSREGVVRKLKLFWFWDVRLEDVHTQNLSWFGSTDPSARTEF
jgi:hypothetical protein